MTEMTDNDKKVAKSFNKRMLFYTGYVVMNYYIIYHLLPEDYTVWRIIFQVWLWVFLILGLIESGTAAFVYLFQDKYPPDRKDPK